MFWKLYVALMVLAAGASASALVLKRAVEPTGFVSAALWALLALQARNITLYHQDGSSTAVGSEAWQYIALGLALLSLIAVVLSYLGVYPPEESPEQAVESDELAQTDIKT